MRPQIVLTFLKSMLSSDKVFRLCQDYGSKLFYLKSYRVSNFSIFKKFIDSLTRLGIETLYNLKIYCKVMSVTLEYIHIPINFSMSYVLL